MYPAIKKKADKTRHFRYIEHNPWHRFMQQNRTTSASHFLP
jgi:hypothetical protein